MGHAVLAATDPGLQAPLDANEDGPQTPGQNHHAERPRVCFEATLHREGRKPLVARFGGIPLQRQKTAVIDDRQPDGLHHPRKELITRLLKRRCELCGQTGHINVHHVRTLAELGPPGPTQPAWAAVMARRKRKALVVCDTCHGHIHAGQPTTLTA